MTIAVFLLLLTIFSVCTSLLTEAIKNFYNEQGKNYASNIVVLVAAALIGGLGTVVYYIAAGIAWTPMNIICILLMIIANWVGSMVGYDKVKQAIEQLKLLAKKKNK
jgi:hypothetical protein